MDVYSVRASLQKFACVEEVERFFHECLMSDLKVISLQEKRRIE